MLKPLDGINLGTPNFFDSMANQAEKNSILNSSRFGFKSKIAHDKNTRSCADLARRKYEEALQSGKQYNQQILADHYAKIKSDNQAIKNETALKRSQKKSLGEDLLIQMQQDRFRKDVEV